MTAQTLYSQCDCGTFNSSDAALCSRCGVTLPWHDPFATTGAASSTTQAASATAQAAATAAPAYWQKAFHGSTQGPVSSPHVANRFCSQCGTNLRAGANFCPQCRSKVRRLDGTDTRVALLCGGMIAGGFLIGVVWCSFLINRFNPNAVPGTHAPQTTQTQTAKPLPAEPLPASDDSYQ